MNSGEGSNYKIVVCIYPFTGSYTPAQGINVLRQDVANYITQRDSYPANREDIFLINGGAEGIDVSCDNCYWINN